MAIVVTCPNQNCRRGATFGWTTDDKGLRRLQVPAGWRLTEVKRTFGDGTVEEHQFLTCSPGCEETALQGILPQQAHGRRP